MIFGFKESVKIKYKNYEIFKNDYCWSDDGSGC